MATYYADKVLIDPTGMTTNNVIQPKYLEDGDITVVATYTVPTGQAAFTAADTIQLLDIPPGVRVTGIQLDTQKMDSSGSPTLVFNVGDVNTANRFFALSTAGQAGGYGIQAVTGVLGFTYAAKTRVLLTVTTTAAAVPTAGNKLVFVINYNADP
jgi:hypothetical protein